MSIYKYGITPSSRKEQKQIEPAKEKRRQTFPFTAWELEVMGSALLEYAERPAFSPVAREQMRNLSKRLQLAKPGVVRPSPRDNAVYGK